MIYFLLTVLPLLLFISSKLFNFKAQVWKDIEEAYKVLNGFWV